MHQHYYSPHYPNECISIPKNGQLVWEIIHAGYPDACQLENLPAVPPTPDKILNIRIPGWVLWANRQHPLHLILCCVSVVSPQTLVLLLAAWDHVQMIDEEHPGTEPMITAESHLPLFNHPSYSSLEVAKEVVGVSRKESLPHS